MTTDLEGARLDRAKVRQIAADVREALGPVAQRHGLTVQVGGGTYDPDAGMFRPKVEFSAADRERREFGLYARSYGLEPGDFGASVTLRFARGPEAVRIVGIAPRSRRYPVVIEHPDGRKAKTTTAAILRALGRPVPTWEV